MLSTDVIGLSCYMQVGSIGGLALGLIYLFQEKIVSFADHFFCIFYQWKPLLVLNAACYHLMQLYIPKVPGMPADYPVYPDYYQLGFDDVWITTPDGVVVNGWLVWPNEWTDEDRRQRPVVIFYHENAGNMAFRLPFLRRLVYHLGCSAFILSYRGYGRSQGSPTEPGLKLDAQAALDHVLSRVDIDTSRVILMGRSLGAAVAIHTAAKNKGRIKGLVVENTFYNIESVVPDVMPVLGLVVGPGRLFNFLLRNKWWNNREVSQLKDLPTLFLSALQDEMIPHTHMKKLYDVYGKHPWVLVPFPGARHIDAYETHAASYWPVIREFLEVILNQ